MDSTSKLVKAMGLDFAKQVGVIQNAYSGIRGFRRKNRALVAATRSVVTEQNKGRILTENETDKKAQMILQRAGIRVGRNPY